ncbi:MAG: DM13 domain-containing protein [Cyanobacteria bacterium P01_G01_bin.19]
MKRIVWLLSALTLAITPTLVQAEDILTGGELIETGSFVGQSGHTVSGEFQIIKQGETHYLVLQDNFKFDGAPDPKIGFSTNDEFSEDTLFSGLNLDEGKQIYRLPFDFDPAQYDEVTLWCDKFNADLAEAKY